MTRNKMTIAWITNDSSRRTTLKKRRTGIFKKTEDLSILCDVQASSIVYSPEEADPEVWPSYEYMKGMIERFLSMSIVERSQKRVTNEGYLTQRIAKETDRNNKEKIKNNKKEIQEIMNQIFEGSNLHELDILQLENLSLLTSDKLNQLEKREKTPGEQAPSVSPAPAPSLSPPPPLAPGMMELDEAMQAQIAAADVSSSIPTSIQEMMNDQWFMETMALHQDIPLGPIDMGLPSAFVAGTSTGENEEELPEDLTPLFPHIYSP